MDCVYIIVPKLSSLAEVTFALLDRDLLSIDSLDFCSTWALVEVLDELVERALVALCFASYLNFS